MRDKTRPPGRKPSPVALKAKVLAKTTRETPPDATHWSVRTMAKAFAISHSSVQRIWREAGLKPHLTTRFKVSNDPQFEEKVTDIVGLYMNPPDRALVLCVDEKSQIQALDRTQPGLPLKKGRAATMTHDYKRHGGDDALCGDGREERASHRRLPAAAIAPASSSPSCAGLIGPCTSTSTCTSCSTTRRRTRQAGGKPGSPSIPASSCTSRRRAPRG